MPRVKVGTLSPAAQAQVRAAIGAVLPTASSQGSAGEDEFSFQCRALRLPLPDRQFTFAQDLGRRWRFDFAWPPFKVALEVEGLALFEKDRMNGHTSLAGFEGDCEKYATAAILGWQVLRFTQRQVKSGFALDCLVKLLNTRGYSDEQEQKPRQAPTHTERELPRRPESRQGPQTSYGRSGPWGR